MQYLQNNSEKVTLQEIKSPSISFPNYKVPLDESLKHEQYITASIHNIYDEAFKIKDFRTMQFLEWFIKEQGEEEKNSEDIIKKYDLYGTDANSLYMLDSELGTRIYTAPSLVL